MKLWSRLMELSVNIKKKLKEILKMLTRIWTLTNSFIDSSYYQRFWNCSKNLYNINKYGREKLKEGKDWYISGLTDFNECNPTSQRN